MTLNGRAGEHVNDRFQRVCGAVRWVASRLSAAWEIQHSDTLRCMRRLPAGTIDAVVTDPPYGLEFMGKEWDSFRLDEGSPRRRGERASPQGKIGEKDPRYAASAFRVTYGGQRSTTSRCRICDKRDSFRRLHDCGDAAEWILEPVDPDSAPASMLAFQNWVTQWAREVLRVLKPGAHLLAFGGPRTYHRLTAGLEDAGFEIRDSLMWLYGSGFPKSLDVSKAIDKGQGHWRGRAGDATSRSNAMAGPHYERTEKGNPITAEAERWQGWGTALKPGYEPIVLARKPLMGTVADNVREHGTGALNVDACRIDGAKTGGGGAPPFRFGGLNPRPFHKAAYPCGTDFDAMIGRWPANVVLDERAAGLLDASTAGEHRLADPGQAGVVQGEAGGTSRFFYCAKASTAERNAGLGELPERRAGAMAGNAADQATRTAGDGVTPVNPVSARNIHPTVKPIELMRWLCRLVTPPDGLVLDPFAGSGTTGCAAVLEGFRFLGVERERDYSDIARERIAWWYRHRGEGHTNALLAAGDARHQLENSGQLSMLDVADPASTADE